MRTFLSVIAVFIVHVSLGVSLFRARSFSLHPIFRSDLVVFGVPLLLAFAAYAVIVWNGSAAYPIGIRISRTGLVAIGGAVLSFLVSLFVSINLYGS